MTETKDLLSSLGMKAMIQKLDGYLAKQGVQKESRDAIMNSFEMMYEYIPYAAKQGKNPTDSKILAEFLAKKGLKTAKHLGSDPVNCGIAVTEFLLSFRDAVASQATGAPPLILLAYGLAMLDLIEVGNSCEPVQRAYYEALQKQSSVKLIPIRSRTDNAYGMCAVGT